jgi:NAD(P)-dependent dehydrogenase (short-subunit alcohol dehydrogenase family)
VNTAEAYADRGSKAGLIDRTRTLAARMTPDRIMVSCLAPGGRPFPRPASEAPVLTIYHGNSTTFRRLGEHSLKKLQDSMGFTAIAAHAAKLQGEDWKREATRYAIKPNSRELQSAEPP